MKIKWKEDFWTFCAENRCAAYEETDNPTCPLDKFKVPDASRKGTLVNFKCKFMYEFFKKCHFCKESLKGNACRKCIEKWLPDLILRAYRFGRASKVQEKQREKNRNNYKSKRTFEDEWHELEKE